MFSRKALTHYKNISPIIATIIAGYIITSTTGLLKETQYSYINYPLIVPTSLLIICTISCGIYISALATEKLYWNPNFKKNTTDKITLIIVLTSYIIAIVIIIMHIYTTTLNKPDNHIYLYLTIPSPLYCVMLLIIFIKNIHKQHKEYRCQLNLKKEDDSKPPPNNST